jgi:signal transduction histidine kinase
VRAVLPRWHYLYFLLAAFDVLTVCVALYFTHALMDIYVDSVAVNQVWAERVATFTRLGQLAAAANAPGNDIFLSGDVDAELERMAAAATAFHAQLARVRHELEVELPPAEAAPLLERLDTVARNMKSMTGEARLTFVRFRDHDTLGASVRMASMDRRFAEVNRVLGELREGVAQRQQRNFSRQLAAAADEQKHVFLLGGLLVLMVAGATFYGHRTALQAQSYAAERLSQSRELAASNARLQAETREKMVAIDALREANDRLQTLFKRTLELHERKEQHIARELHEEVSQTLASLKLHLGRTPTLSAAGSLAEDALHRLRDLAQDLTPHGMEVIGLAAVLPAHLREWTRGSGLDVRFADKLRLRPPFRVENAAYRVAQEAVSNVVRHAKARCLSVELSGSAEALQLRIVDDGQGFDPQAVRGRPMLGMALMEQRTTMVGGTLELRSSPGAGTAVVASFPLPHQMDWIRAAGL